MIKSAESAAGNYEGVGVKCGAGLRHRVRVHSSLCNIMHVIVCYTPCMHHVSTPWLPPTPVRAKVCEMLDMDFGEFFFHAFR